MNCYFHFIKIHYIVCVPNYTVIFNFLVSNGNDILIPVFLDIYPYTKIDIILICRLEQSEMI